jgi:hypothetical protein
MKSLDFAGVAGLLVFLTAPAAALAGNCGYDNCYGAVAVGQNGAWGYAYGQISAAAAASAAQSGCKGNCDVVRTFANTCGAIAIADNGGWGWSTGRTRAAAIDSALAYCDEYGPNCQVQAWACSP